MATKRIYLDRQSQIRMSGYGKAKYFAVETVPVEDILDLARILGDLDDDPQRFIIRGDPLPHADRARARRLIHDDPVTGDRAPFCSRARFWMLSDLDGVPNPAGLNPSVEPEDGIEYLIGLLPPEFHDAHCYWQWSSSQGFKGDTLSAHLWFWLLQAGDDAELTRWANQVNHEAGRKLIDPALYRAVQPHYTARPVFDGVRDPLPRRSGIRLGLDPAVAIEIPALDAAAPLQHGNRPMPSDLSADERLRLIGSAKYGFRIPILSAIATHVAKFEVANAEASWPTLKECIRARILAADPAGRPERTIARYASDRHLDDIFGWVTAREQAQSTILAAPDFPSNVVSLAEGEQLIRAALDRFMQGVLADFDGRSKI